MPGSETPRVRSRPGRVPRRLLAAAAGVFVLLLAVVLAFAPSLAASVVKGTISGSFSDSIRGSAAAERVTVGWFGPIRVEGLRLEDDAGGRVIEGDATAGIGLLGVLTGSTDFGDIRLVGEAEIRASDDGTTNLERALEPADPDAPRAPAGPLIPPGTRATIVLDPTDVRYTDPRLAGLTDGRLGGVVIAGATGTVRIRPGSPVTIEFDAPLGTLAPGSPDSAARPAQNGGDTGTLTIDLQAEVPEGATDLAQVALTGTARLRGLPTALLDAVAGAGGVVNGVLGEDLGIELTADALSPRGGTVAVDASSPQAELRYRGEVRSGDAATVVATEDTVLRISGIAERFGARAAGVVPLFARVEKDPARHEPAELRLTRLELPLNADPLRAVLEGVVQPGVARYELTRPLAALLRVAGGGNGALDGRLGGRLGRTTLSMSEGVLRYADLSVPIGEYTFTSEAAFDLIDGTEDVTIRVPAGAIADDVAGGLGGAFDRIAEDTMVPIYRRGPIGQNNPFEPDFRSVLEDALGPGGAVEDRIRRGIEDLIPPDVRQKLPRLPLGPPPGDLSGGGDGRG